MKEYNPKPIDLSEVELPDNLTELREAIAENAHDIWALSRKNEGSFCKVSTKRKETNRDYE